MVVERFNCRSFLFIENVGTVEAVIVRFIILSMISGVVIIIDTSYLAKGWRKTLCKSYTFECPHCAFHA